MKAEINSAGRLQVHPCSLTEQVALFQWFEGLPKEAREPISRFLQACYFDGAAELSVEETRLLKRFMEMQAGLFRAKF
jgi:hypothetical protein